MTDNWIRKQRKLLNVSQYKMAKHLGITFHQLSAWEMDKEVPALEEAEKIRNFFSQFHDLVSTGAIKLQKHRVKRSFSLSNEESEPLGIRSEIEDNIEPPVFFEGNLDECSPKAITLFSGFGGMSLGLVKAGYRVMGHVELEESAREIYRRNFPSSACLGTDVRAVTNDEVRDWKNKYGEIDILAGGPPCQGFSLAGKRNVFDPRNELYNEFARIAEILKPKCIILENVRTFLNMESKDGSLVKDDLIRRFDEAGYTLVYKSINAKNYGVPQSRERAIFLGVRKDIAKNKRLSLPPITHDDECSSQLFESSQINPIRTFRDAVQGLENLESGEFSKKDKWHFAVKHPDHVIKMLRDVPEGKSAHDNPDPQLRPTSGYNTTYKRLTWNEPSSTISTNFSMISGSRNVHPRDTRSLTIREAMRCQTFPDAFLLKGKLGDIRKGIGNAVPPALAEAFARYIKQNFL